MLAAVTLRHDWQTVLKQVLLMIKFSVSIELQMLQRSCLISATWILRVNSSNFLIALVSLSLSVSKDFLALELVENDCN